MAIQGLMTRVLHSGWDHDPTTGACGLPIYLSAGYQFRDTTHAANLFALEENGYIYSRLGNPTVAALEEGLADMEEGVCAVACSSGQAAFTQLLMALVSAGDHIIVSTAVYGGTFTLVKNQFGRYSVEATFVDVTHPCNVEEAVRPNTRAIICETIGNPIMNVAPIESLAKIAKRNDIPLIVDNTFAPALCAPIALGANVVVHSTTKYISGRGNVIGGVIVDGGNMDWSGPKWASLNTPDPAYHGVVYTEKFGPAALGAKIRTSQLRDVGGCPSAFDSYLLYLALGSLPLRMERHSANGLAAAKYLASHPKIERVSYPGLESHPQYELARGLMPNGCGGMMAFDIKGGLEAGTKFINGLKLIGHVANLGDSRSLVSHSASTTHSQLTPQERAAAGIGEGMVRFSVGIESIEDIIADLDAALGAV